MAGEPWPEVPFPEAIDFQEGPGILAKDFCKEGVPLVRLSGLERGGSVLEGCNFLDPATVQQRWLHFALQEGDILLSSSASLGRIAVVGCDAVGAIPYTGIIRMRPRDERVHAPFIRYLLEAPDFQRQAEIAGVGSVMRHFGPMHLRQMTLRLPPLESQRAIAHILGTLDDKIELNRRMNETLESMARALFKSWFVDFDPVRAKAEGRDPGLPQPLADLFQDSFEDSELGEIPRGWRIGTLGELSQKPQYGFTASAKDAPVGPKFLRITDINKLPWIEWSSVPHCEISEEEFEQYRIQAGDILIARMADPGHGVMIEEDVEGVFASYLIRFRPADSAYARFIQYWLRSNSYWELVNARHAGTTRASLNAQVLRAFQLIVPSQEVADTFGKKIAALRSKVIANVEESRTLAALRDTLLPKLISGDLRVQETERIIGGHV